MKQMQLFLCSILPLFVSCASNTKYFNFGVGEKGERKEHFWQFEKGKSEATRLFVVVPEGAVVRKGVVSFSTIENKVAINFKANNRDALLGKGVWAEYMKKNYVVGKDVYVVFDLKSKLSTVSDNQPISVQTNAFPDNAELYLWHMPKWSLIKIE